MLINGITSKNNLLHKQISGRKQSFILNIFPTALWYAEIHFRCVLCGYRRVRRSPHSDHRVGTHRGNMGHLHQHYLELLRPLINAMEIFVTTAMFVQKIPTRWGTSRRSRRSDDIFPVRLSVCKLTRGTYKSYSCKDANRATTCAKTKISLKVIFISFT